MPVEELTNEAAVKALSIVAKQWLRHRGLEAYIVTDGARRVASESYEAIPSWARERPSATKESGDFVRKMLASLKAGNDDEVSVWTDQAIREVSKAEGQVLDPLTLAIGGAILIGAILAARVKRIGSAEFYEGVPKELANVIKAASSIKVPVDSE